MRRSGGGERLGRHAQDDRQEPHDHREVHAGEQADAALAVPELVVGQAGLDRGRGDLPGFGLAGRRHVIRRPYGLITPGLAGQPDQRQHEQQRHQHPERDLTRRMPGDERPAQRREPPLMQGDPGPCRLVGDHVRADHHRDQDGVHRQRQRAQPGGQPVQPEFPGRVTGRGRAHPARQVAEQERQQRQPQHPDLALRGQAAPRVDLHVPVHVQVRVPVPVARAVVRGAVEARDRITADLLRCEVAEDRVRRRPADPVHAEFGYPAAFGLDRKLHARQGR